MTDLSRVLVTGPPARERAGSGGDGLGEHRLVVDIVVAKDERDATPRRGRGG